MIERGAGYAGVPEMFLQGRPLNVTDLAFGPDGAMYFITGGRRTKALFTEFATRADGPLNKATSSKSSVPNFPQRQGRFVVTGKASWKT